ncbi:MAG TPA: hypothetical protein VIO43_04995 [Lutibacter sp.]
MKNQFKITGLYYEELGFKFRKYLDIKIIDTDSVIPDLMVCLMNPGSSKALDGNNDGRAVTLAKPDNTQSQIMKVMLNAGFEYARVLNLSDLREPKSNEFYKKLAELNSKGIAHSIFDSERKDDFNQLWVNNVPVIYGWGVNGCLKPMALKALDACNVALPFGLQKPNYSWAYYHPLPPVYSKQQEWVEKITEELSKN